MKKPTRVNHQPEVRLPEGNESVTSPIYQSVKFTFESLEATMSREARESGFNYTPSPYLELLQPHLLQIDFYPFPTDFLK